MNYSVIKAINKYRPEEEVWFTPSIPVPFGPYGKGNLPGLILKFKVKFREIVADKIIFTTKDIKIEKLKGIKKTKAEVKEEEMKKLKQIRERYSN